MQKPLNKIIWLGNILQLKNKSVLFRERKVVSEKRLHSHMYFIRVCSR